ncbi:hypothetical protein E4198_10185 [Streptomyces sp. RKND-216]|uniref:hypothetical protein n=1 Tax=Streptomyces sp. RKND-216 TaxID=2562581 RepID=UPI00109DFAA4|nr:hypothetical protein [Streptomyces sp. RKND-216]THA25048.1 hypothetical protein E4198_10185 [Streptomyces sp. RKND-216]
MRRTRLGLGAATGTAALALLIGGCGSDGGDSSDGGKDKDQGSTSTGGGSGGGDGGKDDGGSDGGTTQGESSGGGADTGGDGGSEDGGSGGGGSGGGDDAATPFQGPWASGMKGAEGELLVLIFNGTEVSLAGPDVACQGTLKAGDGPAKLDLKCRDANDGYASGTVTEIDDKGLSVKWASGRTAEFVKGAAPVGPPE